MFISYHQNAGKNHNVKIANRIFENMAEFIHFGTTVTNQNLIHEEIKSRLNSADACHHSVRIFLSSCLVSKIVKIKIHKTVVLYGFENWSLTLRKEHRLKVY
jgi:hypothetical protein